jgi:hypothetical protein
MKSWRVKLMTVLLALFAIPSMVSPVFAAGRKHHHRHKHHHARRNG